MKLLKQLQKTMKQGHASLTGLESKSAIIFFLLKVVIEGFLMTLTRLQPF